MSLAVCVWAGLHAVLAVVCLVSLATRGRLRL